MIKMESILPTSSSSSKVYDIVFSILISGLWMVLLLLFVGCGEEDEIISSNRRPTIKELSLAPYGLVGKEISITGIAMDPDQSDEVTVSWRIDGKHISNGVETAVSGQEVEANLIWTPDSDRKYEIEMTASDGELSASKLAKIEVRDGSKIIPGEGAAGIKLKDSITVANTIYGEPLSADFDSSLNIILCDYGFLHGVKISIIDDNRNQKQDISDSVLMIIVYGLYTGVTPGGNTLYSPRDRIIAEFGPPEEITDGKVEWYWKRESPSFITTITRFQT